MENLIPIVNRLQDVFHSVGMLDTIDLPQIAVVGSQSSGKSSVLENIVGRDFLPRGVGIVTRRPLILQLIHTTEELEYGEFLHQPQKKYVNFNDIRQEIQDETDRVTGKEGKTISALPIHLKIYSPNVLNLTLIDLPGITKVPVGNQPNDIEYQIKQMILQYIKKPNCIILAVSPSNTDIANSEALKLARAVDKTGDRTIGVLTKIDLMDKGTDAMEVIQGRQIPLKLGFVGVVLRGQKDIEGNKPISEALEDEAEFFKSHSAYKSVANKMGIPFLTRKLNNILLEHIRKCLPEIRNKIAALIAKAQQRLQEYGVPLEESEMSHGAVLLQLLTQFSKEFSDIIDGVNSEVTTDELFGGARINYIFTQKFVPQLSRMDACEGLSDYDIRTAIRNAKGPRSSLFIPESSFIILVKRQVKKLEDPSLKCVSQVFEELVAIVDHAEKHFVRFPKLREQGREFVIELLRRYEAPLKVFIKNLIQIEMAYVNTNHPDFFDGGNATSLFLQQQQQQQQQQQHPQHPQHPQGNGAASVKPPLPVRGQPPIPQRVDEQDPYSYNPPDSHEEVSDRDQRESQIIKALLKEYFNIVRKNIADSVPKAIMHFLVNMTKSNLQSEFVQNLYKSELFDELLQENDEIAQKRKGTQKMLSILLRAQDILNEVRDMKL